VHNFHASGRKQEEDTSSEAKVGAAAAVPTTATAEESTSSWSSGYSVALGLALAVPAINYEWYLVNEETQLAACFIGFTAIVYKQFGGAIFDALEEDGKRLLAENNKVEDEAIAMLEDELKTITMQEQIVQDAEDIKALKIQTYENLNAAGQIKPKYEFKAQIEKMLNLIEAEEVSMREKGKVAIMEEATDAVNAEFSQNKSLQKTCLANAVAALKGEAVQSDPVKAAYLKFFANKKKAPVNEAQEAAAARESIITKLNATAKGEGFYFEFDASGKPQMTA